jgi:hypothetical protein
MAVALSIFGVAFAAFCVWLTVRIVNRRKKPGWKFWAALIVLLVGYPLSIGPALVLSQKHPAAGFIMPIYRPIGTATFFSRTVQSAVIPYVQWWADGASVSYDATGRIELVAGRVEAEW